MKRDPNTVAEALRKDMEWFQGIKQLGTWTEEEIRREERVQELYLVVMERYRIKPHTHAYRFVRSMALRMQNAEEQAQS